jgi:phage baseplate assembly protein W
MPNTSNYNFEYESPTSLPGTTLTGGPGGGSPILAIQVDSALAAIESRVDINTDNIADNTNSITANSTAITNLENWTRRGTTLVTFAAVSSFTVAVNFGFTFPTAPTVLTNIDSSAGATARWESRATVITTTGFTLFVYQSQAVSGSWTDIPVSWLAHYE